MQKNLKIRLQDILNVDLLAGAEVLAGSAGMDHEITSVNVMEVPDIIDWVRPGEFLLTTAYTFSNNMEAFNSLLPLLSERGVCGIGIKLKRYIDDLPESVRQTAEELKFPLIKIPIDVSYGDLMKRIFTYIIGAQTRLLEQINQINNKIKEIMLRHGGIEKFAELIHSVVQSPLLITDDIYRSHYLYCEDQDWCEKLESLIPLVINNGDNQNDLNWSETHSDTDSFDGCEVPRITIPIYFEEILYGNIVIWDINNKIGANELFVIESAASLIALHSVTQVTLSDRENVHRTNFLELLLSASSESQSKAMLDAEYFEYNTSAYHQCVVMRIDQGDMSFAQNITSRRGRELRLILLAIVNQLQRRYRSHFISASKGNEASFLLEYDQVTTEETRVKLARAFTRLLLEIARAEQVEPYTFVGIGQCYLGTEKLSASLHEAKQVVRVLQAKKDKSVHSAFFSDLGFQKLFGNPDLRDDLLAFSDEMLKSLIEYDNGRDGELLETVRVYFENSGNLRKMSEVLFTHYNTVIYRVNRIRDVFKIDLKDPETAFNLQLAIKIRDMLT
ncbi:MAG: PucR family transcriptional regulator [Chloroflexi bacterium]|nr:PucR family transcriptional regulator [Chloroflexota bacterium]